VLLVAAALGATAASCGGEGKAGELQIDLSLGDFGDRSYTVSCDPHGGDVPQPTAVCAALRATPALLKQHPGRDHSCPCCRPLVRVTGEFARRQIKASFAPCVTGQEEWASRWTELVGYGRG